MIIRQLEAFRALMEGYTVTQAGERLYISQPAVSKLIARMEYECGFKLFLRERGRLSPTPEAQMLYADVQRVFVGIDKIEQAAADIRLFNRGQLSLAAMPALALRYLPGMIAEFSRSHPNIRIVLHSHTSRAVADHVANQQVDFGLGGLHVENPGTRHEHLCSMPAVCVLPLGHPLTERETLHISDLRNEAFISLASEDHLRNTIDRAFEEASVERDIKIETHIGSMACAFVANGVGITVVDPFSAAQFRSDEVSVRPLLPIIPFDIWILYPTTRKLSQITLMFLEKLRAAVRSVDIADIK